MSYTLLIKRSAQRDLAALHPRVRVAVDRTILALADNPRPPGALPLKGEWKGFWRVRVGEHRIIYALDDKARVVTVAVIGAREGIY